MRKAGGLIIGGGSIAALSASIAIAAGGTSPDGGPAPAPSGDARAQAATSILTCGRQLSTVIKRGSGENEDNNTAFEELPGAAVSITVPEGATRCVTVLFTAEAACYGNGAENTDFCYVRAVRNSDPLQPDGGLFQVFVSEAPSSRSQAAHWSRRLPAGTYRIALQRRTFESATSFQLDDWSFVVEVSA